MNSSNSLETSNRAFCRSWRAGQSIAELVLITPVLVLLLLAGGDFARIFYMTIAVNSAARAGAQYGSQTVITAANANAIVAAAKTDGSSVPNLSVTASQCTCEPGTSVTACPTGYCTNNPNATFVVVVASALSHLGELSWYPLLDNSEW